MISQNTLPNVDDLLLRLANPKKYVSSVPTYVPRNWEEMFVLYDDGANYRLYIYINGSWRYSTLT